MGVCATSAVHGVVQTPLPVDAFEAASSVLRTSTETQRAVAVQMRVAALTTLVAGARAMSLKAGAQVPKFAVTAHTGAAVSSDSLAGSAYCLWFYPKADTGGATTAWTRGAFKIDREMLRRWRVGQ